jgi:hypothetical protein
MEVQTIPFSNINFYCGSIALYTASGGEGEE